MLYCNSITDYSRFVTRSVKVGNISIGGSNPVRLQSMTTTNTMDTKATVEQCIRMINAGCELVRITAPSIHEAKNLQNIKNDLGKKGYVVPLVADIHFTPNAAEIAARIVEKVRVNPGNYADKKKFQQIEYTDASYDQELERIHERFTPLVKICKEHGTAMRIGTNHGSLSDRIMSRYGDSPVGMVESALEFIRICESHSFYELVVSMKSSNPQVMVHAYRLLVQRMKELGMNYPLHLGVTEAGDGEDGRIKSAVGIGALLEDGLGDTIRVSLTEEPEAEIPVAKQIVARYANRRTGHPVPDVQKLSYDPFTYSRRASKAVVNIGGKNVPVVIADLSKSDPIDAATLASIGYHYDAVTDKWNIDEQAPDYIFVNSILDFELPGTLRVITWPDEWKKAKDKTKYFPIFTAMDYPEAADRSGLMNFIMLDCYNAGDNLGHTGFLQRVKADPTAVICLSSLNELPMPAVRRMFIEMMQSGNNNPVVLICDSPFRNMEETVIHFSAECGSLLLDGLGDGLCLGWNETFLTMHELVKNTNSAAFGILQATRTRISKTEYISCPSCGRTLFDLQETTARIRERTSHLKGVKIGIMGCIVNGPGEMADADYGYVGTGPGKITLYKGKEVIRKNIDAAHAVDELIELIREYGDWIEKK